MSNMVRAKVTIKGTRTLLQAHFGKDAIPLEKQERKGVAGNDPGEWKKTCMVTKEGQLYIPGTYVFGCLKNGARFTKKGKGSIQMDLYSTLEVEDVIIPLDRFVPKDLTEQDILVPLDGSETFIYVAGVKNKSTGGRNIRYRLATRPGWNLSFTINWDKTIVSREQMKAVLLDSGKLCGLGDGLKIGCGRFEVLKIEELSDATEETTEGGMELQERNGVDKGRQKMRPVLEKAFSQKEARVRANAS